MREQTPLEWTTIFYNFVCATVMVTQRINFEFEARCRCASADLAVNYVSYNLIVRDCESVRRWHLFLSWHLTPINGLLFWLIYFWELGLRYLVQSYAYLYIKVDFEPQEAGELTFDSSTSLWPTILGAWISYWTYTASFFVWPGTL